MAYVDVDYYKNTFKGSIIQSDSVELERRLKKASRDIDGLTYNRITKKGFDNLTNFQKEIIKESVCMHADFDFQFGGLIESPLSGYTAGTTSVSLRDLNISGQNGIATSRSTFNLLKQSGLTVRLF